MPRYFFDVGGLSDAESQQDAEGMELPGLSEAEAEAIASAKQLVSQDLMRGGQLSESMNRQFFIRDEHGQVLSVIPFAKALDEPDHAP